MIGQTLSHYKILGKLGGGGMGQVYVAEDTKLGRKVALKLLPPEMASSERLMRFEREAKAVAALNHANIVVIYSVEEVRPGKAEESLHFLTMELVEGTFPPMRASSPDWSPDGETIAFEGQLPGHHWKIYLVPADGGTPRPLTPDDRGEGSPTWSPDGRSLAFSLADQGGIHIFDLDGGKASEVAGSEALHWPDWSPDGRYLAAHSTDHHRQLLFDFTARRWRMLAEIEVGDQYWSADGKYLYVVSLWWLGPLRSVHRVRVRDGSLEEVVSLKDVRQAWGIGGTWVGATPDGSPLLLRDLSIHHIYALDWEP